jgi:DNA polymerase
LFQSASETPFTSDELSPEAKAARLAEMDEQYVRGCLKCSLSATRRSTVFGEGDPDAKLMFIGEGPGFNEDQTGRPFVGRAGQKLDEMIVAMGSSRDQVFICNVVKCRAYIPGPGAKDRPPLPEEAAACMPYLERQIEIVRPRVIVTLGLSAMQYLLGVKQSMSRMRGNWQAWRGIPVMPTFHPSYILRNYTTEVRRAVWEDLKQVKTRLAADHTR